MVAVVQCSPAKGKTQLACVAEQGNSRLVSMNRQSVHSYKDGCGSQRHEAEHLNPRMSRMCAPCDCQCMLSRMRKQIFFTSDRGDVDPRKKFN